MLYLGDIGELYVDEGGIDPGAIMDVVRRHEGVQAADAAAHWLERRPDRWVVTRDAEQRMTGLACFVDLDDIGDEDAARDPVAAAFRGELAKRESMRPGERARFCRFWMCVEHHQTACPTQTLLFSRMSVELGLLPGLAVGAAVHIPAGEWKARADMTHELMCRLEVDGVDVGVFGHDWRKESPVRSFGRLLQVLRGVPGTPKAPPEKSEMVFLDRSEFARAARKALKDFYNPARLEDNPLTAAPLVVRHGVEPGSPEAVDALRETLRETCRSIRGEEDEVFARVLEQTYLRPTPKQLAAADELGLSFRTYRRRLSVAVGLAITRLWERETSGAGP